MASETQQQDKHISSDSLNSVFDSTNSLLSNFMKDLTGYVKKVIQERLADTRV